MSTDLLGRTAGAGIGCSVASSGVFLETPPARAICPICAVIGFNRGGQLHSLASAPMAVRPVIQDHHPPLGVTCSSVEVRHLARLDAVPAS